MKNAHRPYFICSLIIFVLALGLTVFQYNLVSDQAELTATLGAEKKEKFEKELWAFRTADKLFGWGVTVPRKDGAEAFDVLRKVRRDTQNNAYIILLMYAASTIIIFIGFTRKSNLQTK